MALRPDGLLARMLHAPPGALHATKPARAGDRTTARLPTCSYHHPSQLVFERARNCKTNTTHGRGPFPPSCRPFMLEPVPPTVPAFVTPFVAHAGRTARPLCKPAAVSGCAPANVLLPAANTAQGRSSGPPHAPRPTPAVPQRPAAPPAAPPSVAHPRAPAVAPARSVHAAARPAAREGVKVAAPHKPRSLLRRRRAGRGPPGRPPRRAHVQRERRRLGVGEREALFEGRPLQQRLPTVSLEVRRARGARGPGSVWEP